MEQILHAFKGVPLNHGPFLGVGQAAEVRDSSGDGVISAWPT
jgi:hypothetical protein